MKTKLSAQENARPARSVPKNYTAAERQRREERLAKERWQKATPAERAAARRKALAAWRRLRGVSFTREIREIRGQPAN